jgi:hypothetical protein
MLELVRKIVKIKKVTAVEEFNGQNRKYGCSLRLEWIADNTVLDYFDKDVRKALYEKDTGKNKAVDGQQELSLPQPDVELTRRKCVNLEMPLHFIKGLPGYTIIFHRGATEASDIKLGEVDLDSFAITAHDGGSVLVSCRAYMKPPVEQRGYIDHMSATEIEITLTAPTEAQLKLEEGGKKKPKKIVEDPFANTDIPPLEYDEQDTFGDTEEAA